ncbi:hypothetical protein [Shouchella clausii]|uniref:Uncharacterized protein n=1 Tax=Shouchella clausii TaxID=79880 RepID=A0A268NVV8_SHOCL|nr:hypothetical protein [Shouchella clausii]PAE87653.1 hypothetical protein CHH72_17360 [Shouchella clausii]
MLIIGMMSLIVAIYIGLILGISEKFKNNRIRLTGGSKLMIPLLPVILFFLHCKIFAGRIRNNHYRLAFGVIKFYMTKFPILVGIIIQSHYDSEWLESTKPGCCRNPVKCAK